MVSRTHSPKVLFTQPIAPVRLGGRSERRRPSLPTLLPGQFRGRRERLRSGLAALRSAIAAGVTRIPVHLRAARLLGRRRLAVACGLPPTRAVEEVRTALVAGALLLVPVLLAV